MGDQAGDASIYDPSDRRGSDLPRGERYVSRAPGGEAERRGDPDVPEKDDRGNDVATSDTQVRARQAGAVSF